MKVLLILAFALAVAGTAIAYGYTGVSVVAASPPEPSEPAALLLSGGALLAVAHAVRRYTL
jgi:hypothetical protein